MPYKFPELHKKRIQEVQKKYYKENRDKILNNGRKRYEENLDKEKERSKKYYQLHKKERHEYRRARIELRNQSERTRYAERIKTDPQYKLAKNIRTRLYLALRLDYKTGSAVRNLGCSIGDLKKHLESKFKKGMSWENYGSWHIDHIKPLSLFDLSDRKQFLLACHYTNLQPLWAKENYFKSNKYD